MCHNDNSFQTPVGTESLTMAVSPCKHFIDGGLQEGAKCDIKNTVYVLIS